MWIKIYSLHPALDTLRIAGSLLATSIKVFLKRIYCFMLSQYPGLYVTQSDLYRSQWHFFGT